MSKATNILFQPFSIKSLNLKNRIVMAPMTRNQAPNGVPGEKNKEYYRKRAEGGVGLILTEGTVVDRPTSKNEQHIPFFHGDAALNGWSNIANSVHEAGGKIGPQIWHVGAIPRPDAKWVPEGEIESPSGVFAPEKPRGKAMTEEDIADTVAAFVKSAVAAKEMGMDVIEFHGAHGYLIDSFFWSATNLRKDQWGGDTLKARTRFAADIIRETRAAVGEDLPIIIRLSQWKQQDFGARLAPTPDEMTDWLTPLVDAGVDILHCSQRRFWEPEFPEVDGEDGLNFAGWAKKLMGVPTISVGSVGLSGEFVSTSQSDEQTQPASLDRLTERMEREEFDLIAVGRALITNPDWVNKVQAGAFDEIKGFTRADVAELV